MGVHCVEDFGGKKFTDYHLVLDVDLILSETLFQAVESFRAGTPFAKEDGACTFDEFDLLGHIVEIQWSIHCFLC